MSFAFIENHWYLFALLLFSGSMLIWPTVKRRLSPARDIGNLEATRLINSANALLVDLRETKEFEGGRLPKAVHIPLSQLASRGDELARHAGRPVVAYCTSGNSSGMAAKMLARVGFKDIYQLAGGYRAWKDAGLPIEK